MDGNMFKNLDKLLFGLAVTIAAIWFGFGILVGALVF